MEDARNAIRGLGKLGKRIGIFGHTHVPIYFSMDIEEKIDFTKSPQEEIRATTSVEGSPVYLLFNPGSVGQPRNRDPQAAWGIMEIDGDDVTFDFRKTPYDIGKVQRRMQDAGLPRRLIDRLAAGR